MDEDKFLEYLRSFPKFSFYDEITKEMVENVHVLDARRLGVTGEESVFWYIVWDKEGKSYIVANKEESINA